MNVMWCVFNIHDVMQTLANSKGVQVTRGIHTDCLLNYETVKYFNGEEHESERYQDAIRQYQIVEFKVLGNSC